MRLYVKPAICENNPPTNIEPHLRVGVDEPHELLVVGELYVDLFLVAVLEVGPQGDQQDVAAVQLSLLAVLVCQYLGPIVEQ